MFGIDGFYVRNGCVMFWIEVQLYLQLILQLCYVRNHCIMFGINGFWFWMGVLCSESRHKCCTTVSAIVLCSEPVFVYVRNGYFMFGLEVQLLLQVLLQLYLESLLYVQNQWIYVRNRCCMFGIEVRLCLQLCLQLLCAQNRCLLYVWNECVMFRTEVQLLLQVFLQLCYVRNRKTIVKHCLRERWHLSYTNTCLTVPCHTSCHRLTFQCPAIDWYSNILP